jgi:hypothetical protein
MSEQLHISTRITMDNLLNRVDYLNSLSKRKYKIYDAYGKVQLAYIVDEKTGCIINPISPLLSKSELYDVINTIINYIQAEKEEIKK